MVTKQVGQHNIKSPRSVLAKIFMVTKHAFLVANQTSCSVLAKIFMVTKQF